MARKGRDTVDGVMALMASDPEFWGGLDEMELVRELAARGYQWDRRRSVFVFVGVDNPKGKQQGANKRNRIPLWQPVRIRDGDREVEPQMLILTYEANRMIQYAIDYKSDLEVGGFGRTRINDQGDIVVDEIYIPPQIVQGAHTDIAGPSEEQGQRKDADGNPVLFGFEAAMAYFASRGESWSDWRLWWHSHSTMGVTHSGTDTGTLEKIARNLDWAVGIIGNTKGERSCWIAQSVPFATQQDPFPLGILPMDLPRERELINEMMSKVEKKTYSAPVSHYNPRSTPGAGFSAGAPEGNGSARPQGGTASSAPSGAKHSTPSGSEPGSKAALLDMDADEFGKWLHSEGPVLLTAGRGGDAE